jgi:hypothetical protein
MGLVGPAASEHKTLQVYSSENCNYLKVFVYLFIIFLCNENFKCILSLMHLINGPTSNEPQLYTYKYAIQGNKCTLTVCLIPQSVNIVPNTMPLPVYIDRHHCYNEGMMSVGTHLSFYYIHGSLFPLLFIFLTDYRHYTSSTHVR